MKHLLPLIALCLPLGLAACASTADPDAPSETELRLADVRNAGEVDRICFTRGINGFRDNQRGSVILTRGVDDDYLVFLRSCPQLDRAQSIALGQGFSGCLRRADRIIVSESAFDLRGPGQIGPLTCQINSIYRWDEGAADIEPTTDG